MRDLLSGVRYLLRGMGWVARRPRQWLFGLIPALIVLAAYALALGALSVFLADVARAVSPFADQWPSVLRGVVRSLIGVLVVATAVTVAVVTFTGVTLVVGDPFYESLSGRVEDSAGGRPPEPRAPLLRQVWRALADAVVVGVVTALLAVLFFFLGLVPLVGQTVVPVVAALVSGYFLTFELTSVALTRRGLARRERFAALRGHRALSAGFGAGVFVVFLVPLGAVIAMPGAVAGGTLLARERLVGTAPAPRVRQAERDSA